MKQSEFVRWLAERGATFENRTRHVRIFYGDKMTHLPRHPGKELKTGLVQAVKRQLGLK